LKKIGLSIVKIEATDIDGVKIIWPDKFGDHRGFFSETFNSEKLKSSGLDLSFCQDNHSLSERAGTLRGLHFQIRPYAQDKLLRVTRGAIYDVAVDIRAGSPDFGKWVGYEISAKLWNQIFIPAGFAHGFCTLEDNTEVMYKVTAPYSPESERGIAWNDEELAIDWPIENREPILSEKDTNYPELRSLPEFFQYES
jgi:dTDP-4-dehydrorhamnose 3,5-epimerase